MNLYDNNIEGYKTPFFLIDELILNQEVSNLHASCKKYWNNYKIGYSVKTNSFPPLLSIFKSKNINAEVVSQDEYSLAISAGYEPSSIICNGPIKDQSWIYQILESNSLLNIDSKRELKYVSEFAKNNNDRIIRIGIRVNFDIESYFPGELNSGEKGGRFGFSLEKKEFLDVIQFLKLHDNIVISGIHLHISTKTRRVEIYRLLVKKFAEIVRTYNLSAIEYFDIGGGFYGGIPEKPGWNAYLDTISDELKNNNFKAKDLKLILEPGVSIIAGCFSYYTRVVDVKETAKQRFIIIDGSRIHIDPLMHKENYFYKIHRTDLKPLTTEDIINEQELVGFTCLEGDRFFILKDNPPLTPGDFVVFDKVGAYTMAFSPLFISYFPPVFIKKEAGDIICLRQKWTVKEFLQLSQL